MTPVIAASPLPLHPVISNWFESKGWVPRRHQLEVLEGSHYLHWTQSPAMARIIADFIGAHVDLPHA